MYVRICVPAKNYFHSLKHFLDEILLYAVYLSTCNKECVPLTNVLENFVSLRLNILDLCLEQRHLLLVLLSHDLEVLLRLLQLVH